VAQACFGKEAARQARLVDFLEVSESTPQTVRGVGAQALALANVNYGGPKFGLACTADIACLITSACRAGKATVPLSIRSELKKRVDVPRLHDPAELGIADHDGFRTLGL
jgi:hypothetical protein